MWQRSHLDTETNHLAHKEICMDVTAFREAYQPYVALASPGAQQLATTIPNEHPLQRESQLRLCRWIQQEIRSQRFSLYCV